MDQVGIEAMNLLHVLIAVALLIFCGAGQHATRVIFFLRGSAYF
jgi:hypothetical protein